MTPTDTVVADAGITPSQAVFEANQPFWRKPGSRLALTICR